MKEYLEKVFDLLFLYKRVKEINPDFELCKNLKTGAFEVHNFSNHKDSLVITSLYLDNRLIEKLKKTSADNAHKLFKWIDEENEKNEQKNLDNLVEDASNKLNEIAKYSFYKNEDLTEEQIKKIIN